MPDRSSSPVPAGEVVVAWHRRQLLREGLVVALRRRPIVRRAEAASWAGGLDAMSTEVGATSCITDLDDQSEEHWAAMHRLSQLPRVRLVGIHQSMSVVTAQRALEVGVRSVVAFEEGLDAVVAALRPDGWRSSAFAEAGPPAPKLDRAERTVLRLVCTGMTARTVADRLGLTISQVDGFKQRAFAKLGVQHQSEAVAVALRHGLLGDDEPGPPGV